MIIYNLTLVALPEVQKEVILEIQSNYIPGLKKNNYGVDYKTLKILSGEGNESTFALQVSFPSHEIFRVFAENYEPVLLEAIAKKFRNQVMPFATLLEEL